jgi:SnoaL-like domain
MVLPTPSSYMKSIAGPTSLRDLGMMRKSDIDATLMPVDSCLAQRTVIKCDRLELCEFHRCTLICEADRISGAFMSSKSRTRAMAAALGFTLLLCGFLTGWLASRHVVLAPAALETSSPALARGNAPETVRTGVLCAMRQFQDGYTKRALDDIGSFMHKLFLQGDDALVLGTDAGEWVRGYSAISNFVRNDWQSWGDVMLNVEGCVISSSGEVAWLATHGSVTFEGGSSRGIRFTATLVRDDEKRWVFRQVQFQWENHAYLPSLRDLLRPSTIPRLRWR